MNNQIETEIINEKRKFAGFWLRFLAFLIDSSITILPLVLFGVSAILLLTWFGVSSLFPAIFFKYVLFLIILPTYFTVLNTSAEQGSFGKRICNIYIGNANDCSPISKIKAYGRFLFFQLLIGTKYLYNYANNFEQSLTIIFLIIYILLIFSFLMAGVTKEKTALYDLLFKTRVYAGSPNNQSNFPSKRNHFMILTVLLSVWCATVPLFKSEKIYFLVLLILLVLLLLQIGVLIYQKINTSSTQVELDYSLPHLKLFAKSISPSIILLIVLYGGIAYLKTLTS